MEPQKYRNPGAKAPATEVRVIHLADAIAELEQLVEREGADTVRSCVLAERKRRRHSDDEFTAVCIVGNAYADWGIPLRDLDLWENTFGAERWINREWLDDSGAIDFRRYGLQFTRAAAWLLRSVQFEQDFGTRWGTALERTRGRAHVLYGTDLDEGLDVELYEHGTHIPTTNGYPTAPYNVRNLTNA